MRELAGESAVVYGFLIGGGIDRCKTHAFSCFGAGLNEWLYLKAVEWK
jgi:hypothetical protein